MTLEPNFYSYDSMVHIFLGIYAQCIPHHGKTFGVYNSSEVILCIWNVKAMWIKFVEIDKLILPGIIATIKKDLYLDTQMNVDMIVCDRLVSFWN